MNGEDKDSPTSDQQLNLYKTLLEKRKSEFKEMTRHSRSKSKSGANDSFLKRALGRFHSLPDKLEEDEDGLKEKIRYIDGIYSVEGSLQSILEHEEKKQELREKLHVVESPWNLSEKYLRVVEEFNRTSTGDGVKYALGNPDHRFFPRVYGHFQNGGVTFVVREREPLDNISGIDIKSVVKDINLKFDWNLKILTNVLEGIKMLHSNSLIHANINENNLWVCNDHVLFGDWSTATSTMSDEKVAYSGRVKYVDPSSYDCIYSPRRESDIYSFGCLILSLVFNVDPSFENEETMKALEFFTEKYDFYFGEVVETLLTKGGDDLRIKDDCKSLRECYETLVNQQQQKKESDEEEDEDEGEEEEEDSSHNADARFIRIYDCFMECKRKKSFMPLLLYGVDVSKFKLKPKVKVFLGIVENLMLSTDVNRRNIDVILVQMKELSRDIWYISEEGREVRKGKKIYQKKTNFDRLPIKKWQVEEMKEWMRCNCLEEGEVMAVYEEHAKGFLKYLLHREFREGDGMIELKKTFFKFPGHLDDIIYHLDYILEYEERKGEGKWRFDYDGLVKVSKKKSIEPRSGKMRLLILLRHAFPDYMIHYYLAPSRFLADDSVVLRRENIQAVRSMQRVLNKKNVEDVGLRCKLVVGEAGNENRRENTRERIVEKITGIISGLPILGSHFGTFHAELVINNWKFSWNNQSRVVPQTLTSKRAFIAYDAGFEEKTAKKSFKEFSNIIAETLCHWNRNKVYGLYGANCQDFVLDLVKVLGIGVGREERKKWRGLMTALSEISYDRKKGCIKVPFHSKFRKTFKLEDKVRVFRTHKELDKFVKKLERENCKILKPGRDQVHIWEAHAVLKSIDRAFWLRKIAMKGKGPKNLLEKVEPLRDERKICNCPFGDPLESSTYRSIYDQKVSVERLERLTLEERKLIENSLVEEEEEEEGEEEEEEEEEEGDEDEWVLVDNPNSQEGEDSV